MKIRMLTPVAGADFALAAGDETERFDDREARRYIDAGYAVPVSEVPAERTRKRAAPETR